MAFTFGMATLQDKAFGGRILPLELEGITTLMVFSIQGTIFSTGERVMESAPGLMETCLKVNGYLIRELAMATRSGQQVILTKAFGLKTTDKV